MTPLRPLAVPLLALTLFGCSLHGPPAERTVAPGSSAPAGFEPQAPAEAPYRWAPYVEIATGEAASVVEVAALPRAPADPLAPPKRMPRAEIRGPLPPEEVARLRRDAAYLPEQPGVRPVTAGDGPEAPLPLGSFASIHYGEAPGSTPPDPELAVGPNHLIAVVNTHFKIHDKSGTTLAGPISFSSFFAGVGPGSEFDPVVAYDEAADRWVMGIDAAGTHFCLAASTGPDPTGAWNRYCFPTNIGGAFFDFPHLAVGDSAVFFGSNQFSGGFLEGRVFALSKADLYLGLPVTVQSHSTTASHSTPWPAAVHGYRQDQWPAGTDRHYFVTERFDGCNHNVWTWVNPLAPGGGSFAAGANLDLCAASGVAAGFPVTVVQSGGGTITANDYRTHSPHFRTGEIWTAQTVACNPGGGTVNCVRWARIDPVANAVRDAGVFGSTGEHRFFPSVAANACGDMAIGYSKSSASIFPGTFLTGRQRGEPAGTLQTEVALRSGELNFTCFDSQPRRWGDYTGLTIDPDGGRFWYLGQYSRDTGSPSCRWGTYVGSFAFAGCRPLFVNGFETFGGALWSACAGCP